MTNTAIETVILNTLGDYGDFALVVLTAVIGVGVAYLAFRFGWRQVRHVLVINTDLRSDSQRDVDMFKVTHRHL